MLVRVEVADTGIGIPEDRRTACSSCSRKSTPRRPVASAAPVWGWPSARGWWNCLAARSASTAMPGEGSTFWFTVRLQPADATARSQMSYQLVSSSCASWSWMTMRRTSKSSSTHLRRWGIACHVSDYAPSALVELKAAHREERPYGLVILDMQMPDMDGRELIRADSQHSRDRRPASDHAHVDRRRRVARTAECLEAGRLHATSRSGNHVSSTPS